MLAEVSSVPRCSQSSPCLCPAAEHKTNPHCGLATTQPQGDVPAKFALHCFSPGHDDLFSCCQSKNFRGASYTYFAVHITGALVLFMTDGIVVSSADRGLLSDQSYMAFFLPNHLKQPKPRDNHMSLMCSRPDLRVCLCSSLAPRVAH